MRRFELIMLGIERIKKKAQRQCYLPITRAETIVSEPRFMRIVPHLRRPKHVSAPMKRKLSLHYSPEQLRVEKQCKNSCKTVLESSQRATQYFYQRLQPQRLQPQRLQPQRLQPQRL